MAEAAALMLELGGIVKRWGGRTVLDGAGLALEPGSVTWLGGRNGAGKTTLLRIAAGLIRPDAGRVSLGGLDPERDRRAYQGLLGYVPAGNGALYARLSVADNLDFWAGLALLRRGARRRAVAAALDRFALSPLAERRVDRLSMGQRQRVRLAAGFLHDPAVMLLDEPHTSLDDDGLGLLAAALDELRGRGGSALWCSPAPDGAFDRMLAIEGRRVVATEAVPA